ncbi:hypothetical protein QUA00_28275 [Microcoleus sp. T2B6]
MTSSTKIALTKRSAGTGVRSHQSRYAHSSSEGFRLLTGTVSD